MLTGRQLHGLAVLSRDGAELGRVRDVIAERESGSIAGFFVESSGLLSRELYLPAAAVEQLDLGGVIVRDKSALMRMPKQLPGEPQLALRGSRLLRAGGGDGGTVADILVENNMVCGLEISQGLLGDLRHKRRFLPRERVENRGDTFIEIDQTLS